MESSRVPMIRKLVQIMAHHSRWFAIGFVVIILGLGYVIVISPVIKEIQIIGRESRDFREQELTQLRTHLTDLSQKRASFESINTERLSLLSRALPSSKDVPQLMIEIPKFFESQGFQVASMNFTESAVDFGDDKPREALKQLNVTVEINGVSSYSFFKLMLSTIEDSLRFFDLRSITYAPFSTRYSLTLITYYLGEGTSP
ncbi:MAG: hypothetical protein V1685_02860 [Parcubacteria group bacterium]